MALILTQTNALRTELVAELLGLLAVIEQWLLRNGLLIALAVGIVRCVGGRAADGLRSIRRLRETRQGCRKRSHLSLIPAPVPERPQIDARAALGPRLQKAGSLPVEVRHGLIVEPVEL